MPKDTFFNLPEKKRNRIISTAMTVFSKTHYKKVTIDSIVDDAEISKGSFYQYFEDKDDLYKYIFNQIGNQKKQVLEQIEKTKEELSFKEYVIRLLEEAERFEKSDSELAELKEKFINECSQSVRKEILKNEIPKSYNLFEEVITCYIKKGELREDLNVRIAAYMITSCTTSLEYYEFNNGENIHDIFIEILDMLIDGMKKTI